jgi:hypothetical protein
MSQKTASFSLTAILGVLALVIFGSYNYLQNSDPVAPCYAATDCSSGDYCYYPAFCGDENSQGELEAGNCQPKPESCKETKEVVCGCDGEDYLNECFASKNGVSVRNLGGCSN